MRRKHDTPDKRLLATSLFVLLIFLISILYYNLKNSWNGKSRFTVIIQNVSENKPENFNLAIISIEPKNLRGNFLLVSFDHMLAIPYGYKTYPVYSVYKLGELDRVRGGGKLLKKSIETTFGLKTDRFLMLKSKQVLRLPESREEFNEFRKKYFSIFTGFKFLRLMFTFIESDMNFVEKLKFFLTVRNLHTSRYNFIDLSNSNASETIKLADGTNARNIDQVSFDNLILADFQDIRVRQEGYTIEVQNATGEDKIAGQFSRILENLGANVIFISTAENEAIQNCQLIYNRQSIKSSIITKILIRDYGCVEGNTTTANMQSDIMIILGRDFLK